jgi:hypothetical protein
VAIWSEEYGSSFKYDSLGAGFSGDVASDLSLALSDYTGHGAALSLNILEPMPGVTSQTLIDGTPLSATSAPEPSTWAMGIIGFAVLGAMGYRRRAKVLALAS